MFSNQTTSGGLQMKKGKGTESVNDEFLLPEAIIQHIQFFLSGKEAAQTSILSKSWYSAWSTRRNLDFDQRDFPKHWDRGEIEFWNVARKTARRYEDLNLKIESFRLWIGPRWERDKCSIANELIVKAMKMGATDLKIELPWLGKNFVLPHEVLGSETLTSLSLYVGRISLGKDGKVSCSKLKSLSLKEVSFESGTICDIISSCPLIENLVVSELHWSFRVGSSNTTRIETLTSSSFECPINLYEFHKLKCLFLENVRIDKLFFADCSSSFPCLKDLTLHDCCYKGFQISSRSLECISFTQNMLRAEFDVPRIRKFRFSGPHLPSVSFKTTSRKWDSDISITPCCIPTTLSFLKLKKLLTELSLSKVSLSFNIAYWHTLVKRFDHEEDAKGLPEPVVENLMIDSPSSVCYALLDCIFWSCRPKFIIAYLFPRSWAWKENIDFLEFLRKRLIRQTSQDCSIPNRSVCGQCDVEEVNVELFEETVAEWRPLPWKTLLDASTSLKDKRKIRFQLRW